MTARALFIVGAVLLLGAAPAGAWLFDGVLSGALAPDVANPLARVWLALVAAIAPAGLALAVIDAATEHRRKRRRA